MIAASQRWPNALRRLPAEQPSATLTLITLGRWGLRDQTGVIVASTETLLVDKACRRATPADGCGRRPKSEHAFQMFLSPHPRRQRKTAAYQRHSSCHTGSLYFVIECLVGVTVDVGAAFEMAKVNQTFQPSGRFSEANSL